MWRIVAVGAGGALVVGMAAAALAAASQEVTEPAPLQDRAAQAQEENDDRADRRGVLDELVAEGVISQEQADIIRERFKERRREHAEAKRQRRGVQRHLAGTRSVVLDTLDMEPRELRAALADGATVGEVAEARGVTKTQFAAALTAAAHSRVDEALESGRIDSAQADRLRQRIEEKVSARVDRIWERGGRGADPAGAEPDTGG